MFVGREWSDWSQELRISGEELRWKFTSDGSVNGWGWRFTVYPIMPAAAPMDMLSDRTVLSRPSIDLVMCLLDFQLDSWTDRSIMPRLVAALASCAQLSSLGECFLIRGNENNPQKEEFLVCAENFSSFLVFHRLVFISPKMLKKFNIDPVVSIGGYFIHKSLFAIIQF